MPEDKRPSHKPIRGHKRVRYDAPVPKSAGSAGRQAGGRPRGRVGYRCQCGAVDYGTGSDSETSRKHQAHLDDLWARGIR